MRPPVRLLAPALPPALTGWIDPAIDIESSLQEPRLRVLAEDLVPTGNQSESGPSEPNQESEPPAHVIKEFDRWLGTWRAWAEQRRRVEELQPLYGFLADAAQEIEQRDNEFELVLCRGLVRWKAPDGTVVRRHVVTEQLIPTVNSKTAEIVIDSANSSRRYEDSQLFSTFDSYQHDRGAPEREKAEQGFREGLPGAETIRHLGGWIGQCLDVDVRPAVA